MLQPIYRGVRKVVLDSITGFAKMLPLWRNAAAKEIIPPLLSLNVSRPLNHHNLPEKFARQFIPQKCIPARRIFFLDNVYVNGEAIVFKNFRLFVPSLTWLRDLDIFRTASVFVRQWNKNVVVISLDTPTALVYDNWSAVNYYHWMIEALPRLLIVQAEAPGILLLVPDPAPGFVKTSLDLMGVTNRYYLKRHRSEVVKVSKLLLPELVYYEEKEEDILPQDNRLGKMMSVLPGLNQLDFDPRQELIVAVRKKLLQHIQTPLPSPSKRLYISRSNQRIRRLTNEADLLPVLEKYGFEVRYFEGMSLEEQIKLMLQAEIFVSLHGSNLVNILFMQEGCRVIEMMNQDYVNDAYYLLASSLRLPYYSMPCTMVNSVPGSNDRVVLNNSDVTVDIAVLEQLIVTTIATCEPAKD